MTPEQDDLRTTGHESQAQHARPAACGPGLCYSGIGRPDPWAPACTTPARRPPIRPRRMQRPPSRSKPPAPAPAPGACGPRLLRARARDSHPVDPDPTAPVSPEDTAENRPPGRRGQAQRSRLDHGLRAHHRRPDRHRRHLRRRHVLHAHVGRPLRRGLRARPQRGLLSRRLAAVLRVRRHGRPRRR